MTRRWELDALRGLMLLLMTITHLPTRLSSPLGQPFGYVSAAEGFVLLSAYMAALVYARLAQKKGIDAMRTAFWLRALKVYGCHTAMLLFLFTFITALGVQIDQPAVEDLVSFYLAQPWTALLASVLLVYMPPLLDILPMYVLFLLLSPWVLAYALRHGWVGLMAISLAVWWLAQFGLGAWVYQQAAALTGLTVPFTETGSFSLFSWQFLWMLGLWMGASRTVEPVQPFSFPAWAVKLAVLLALGGMVWRHGVGQAAFGSDQDLNLLFDKWLLGPLRLLNLFALMVVTLHFGPALKSRIPRQYWLEALGAAALPVFCAHLVVVLLALAFLGGDPYTHAWWVDAALLAGCFATLFVVAKTSLRLDRQHRMELGIHGAGARSQPADLTR